MNELIEDLFETYTHLHDADNSQIICIEEFKYAIQTACKAQRNACIREFRRYSKVNEYEISENWARAISMSKIERQDYE